MPEDVLDPVNKILGRQVSFADQPKQGNPASGTGKDKVESILGRPLQQAQIPGVISSRFSVYAKARQNGFAADKALGLAREQGGAITPRKQSLTEKIWEPVSKIPVAPGKTVYDVGRDISRVAQRLNNPELMTDEQWEQKQKEHQQFFERHLGKGTFTAGAAQGVLETGEELALSPTQLALAFGTFGESALARVAAKTGIKGIEPVAKVVAKLAQAQFISQMAEGLATGIENTVQSGLKGDWETMGKSAVDALASGLMAKAGISHEMAVDRVRTDLETNARAQFGDVEGGFTRGFQSRFDQLNPFQQGQVIEQTVKSSPEYTAVLQDAQKTDADALARSRKQHENRLNRYYSTALQQAYDPNVAARTIRRLGEARERGARIDAENIHKTIREQEDQMYRDRADELRRQDEANIEAGRQRAREQRPEARRQTAEQRNAQSEAAKQIADRRAQVFDIRQLANEPQAEGPRRAVEAHEEDGQVYYAGNVWDEENRFGVVAQEGGLGAAVYRQTPRGVEWLGADGNFSEQPSDLYAGHNPETADTVARIASLSATADTIADQEGATEAEKRDADDLAAIRRELVEGTIDAKEAQKRAGIAEAPKFGDEFLAAQEGRLTGPFHEKSHAEYIADLEAAANADEGMSPELRNRILSEASRFALEQTENNLNHVYRPGDHIISKRGVKWTLDSKGMLHPSDGGQPVPLIKKGVYSNQALQLASSGRVGYGTITREQRRAARAKERAVEDSVRIQQDEVRKEMLLAVQREGLQGAPQEAPRADEAEKAERRGKWISRPPVAPETQATRQIAKFIYKAPASPNSIIQDIAKQKGVSPEEVMRVALANDPARSNSTEARIARLEPGDTISDPFRKDRPWKVEDRNGDLFLRSGQANPLPLDRLNPSNRVRQIMERGQVTTDREEFSEADVSKAAFEAPHVLYGQRMAEEVKARQEGKVKDPPPTTENQAKTQAQQAERRANGAQDAAADAVVKATNPPDGTTLERAHEDVEKATQAVKTAEEGYAQQVEAKGRTEPENEFPQRAPISINLKGKSGVIIQNNREFPFHYELVPLDAVQPSHVWQGSKLVPDPAFPEALQPRTISDSQSQQIALWAEPGTYDFRQYADKTLNGTAGPTILEPGGRPPGGNTRLNIYKKHLQNLESIGDPEQREAALASMRGAMRELANEVEIRRYPDDGADYIVVRMLDKPIETTREAADLGRLFNKSVGVEITDSAKGLSYSKSFDKPLMEDIGRRVEAYDGIIPAMNADPAFFRDIIINRFDIVPEEYTGWFEEKDGVGKVLHDRGRERFVKALLGTVIKNPAVLNRIEGKTPYRALERALGYVVKMEALPDFDIAGKINEAIAASAETQTTDPALSRFDDRWSATYKPDQQNLTGMETDLPPEPDRMVEALWRALHGSDAATPRIFNDRLKSYLGEESSRGGWLFGEHKETPVEAFNRAFSKELKEVAHTRGEKNPEITQEEFDAALRNRELGDQERQEAENRQSYAKGGRGESPEQGERRQNLEYRKLVEHMSPEEMRRTLLTSPVTGLPNRRAFDEAEHKSPAPIVAFSDVDGLKALNDNYGYEAGNALLKVKADALKEAGLEAYHDKGDEFLYRAQTTVGLANKMSEARKILRDKVIEVKRKDGKTVRFRGADFSWGLGEDLAEAESGMKADKQAREASGERKRGEMGGIRPVGINPPPQELEINPPDMVPLGKFVITGADRRKLEQVGFKKSVIAQLYPDEVAEILGNGQWYNAEFDESRGKWVVRYNDAPPGRGLQSVHDTEAEAKKEAAQHTNVMFGPPHPESSGWHKRKEEHEARGEKTIGEGGKEQEKAPAKIPPPPRRDIPDENLRAKKEGKGYITADELRTFLSEHPATREHAPELMRTAQLMAEYVYDADPPVGVERKNALDWVLKERLAGIEAGDSETQRGQFSDPNIEKELATSIMKLHKAADPTTFVHEFAHVIFPLLSDEDLKAIDTIRFKKEGAAWDGTRKGMTPEVYRSLSEKMAHGLEKFLRDQNPTDFSSEVKVVLAKVKEIFRKVYLAFKGDPLSPYTLSSDAVELFDKMFHIVGADVPDEWRKEVAKARADEKRLKKPEATPHPLQKIATELGSSEIADTVDGRIADSIGNRVDPAKPTVALLFKTEDEAVAAYNRIVDGDTKINDAELLETPQGKYAIRFNTETPPPKDILYQGLPERHPGVQLEDLQARLAKVPQFKLLERKLLEVQINNLKNRIRADHGVEERKPQQEPGIAKQALEETKNEKGANGVRSGAHGVPGVSQPRSTGRIPQPPKLGVPGHAEPGAIKRAPRVEPSSLANVHPVELLPLRNARGTPKGVIEGKEFKHDEWVAGLKRAGLPENVPPPTYTLSRNVAEKLIFPGQKQIVASAMSALQQGDGYVVATPTGSGKNWLTAAIVKETKINDANAKILYITRNRTLVGDWKDVADRDFGFPVETDKPKDIAQTGTWATSYAGLRNDRIYRDMKWDLVVADEAGEARRWYDPETQQGRLLMEVIGNSEKAVYSSATPFHSPQEYGYLEKLNLWPKGGFDKWIEQNFAHRKVGDKIVAELDPGKQAKLRQQLIERGQLISQAISYEGLTAHFGVVPVTDSMKRGLDRIKEGFDRARAEFMKKGKKALAEKVSAFEATYTKSFLERERLPQAIELVKKARRGGYQVAVFSEHSAQDLFRRTRGEDEGPSTYQELDDAMGGQLSKIIPPFPDVYEQLRREFGEQIGDYSGRGNTDAERNKAKLEFMQGKTPIIYSTYAAGGIGVSLHDADFPALGISGGDKPRVFVYLGPPYSGVMLEQAMGRGWRFGVKSNTTLVFLATDSAPDIRLMAGKVGPRMKALRAAVVGEKDSLAHVMENYSTDEKIRERQDMLAYAEGNEEKVNASRFQVRSKSREVGIQDWSAIAFPSAESAKNKGMKYGEDVPGGDWSTLFQAAHRLYYPDDEGDARANDIIDAVGNGIVSGKGLPEGVSISGMEPGDRGVVVGAISAAATEEAKIPVDRDKAAAARQSEMAQLRMPGNRNLWVLTYPQGAKVGVWRYLGDPEDVRPTGGELEPPLPKDMPTWYIGNVMSQEQGILGIARQAGVYDVGRDIVRMNRSYQANRDTNFSQFSNHAAEVLAKNGIDPYDNKAVGELWDVVEGKWSSGNPNINKAAGEIADLMSLINDEMGRGGVKVKTPTGEYVNFSEATRDRNYMPHRIDWDANVEDPLTGDVATLRKVMGRTFSEEKRARIIAKIAEGSGMTPNEVTDYLNQYKPGTPVLGHVHRARVANFPIIRKDWPTLLGYFDQAAEAIAIEKNFGSERKKLNEVIDKIPSIKGRATIKSMFDGLLEPQDWTTASSKWYNRMIGFEALSKMTLSAVKVPYHLVHAPLVLGGRVTPVLKASFHALTNPRGVMENATYVGTVARQLNVGDLVGNAPEKSLAHAVFQKYMFNAFYKWGRAIAGESARVWMEQYALHELKGGGTRAGEARRLLRDTMLIGDKAIDEAAGTGRWSPEDLAKAQTGFANFTMFSDNPLQMPGWARMEVRSNTPGHHVTLHRALRLTYALQSFSLKSTSILREKLWDEVMIYHNYKPLGYFILMYPVAGELLRASSAGVKGTIQRGISGVTGQKKQDAWDEWWDELTDDVKHGPLGLLKRYIDDVTFSIGWDRIRRMADPLLNLAEGKRGKQVGPGMLHLLEDEVEQDIGAAWSTLVWKPLELLAQEYRMASSKGSGTPQEHEKEEKKLLQYLFDEFPITKEIPQLQDWLKSTKKSGGAAVRYF